MNVATGHRFDQNKHIPIFNEEGWRFAFADRLPPESRVNCCGCRRPVYPACFVMEQSGDTHPLCLACGGAYIHQRWPHLDAQVDKRGVARGVLSHSPLTEGGASWMKGDRYA